MNNQRFFLIEFIVLILISPYIFMEKIYYFGLYKLLSIQLEKKIGYYDELSLVVVEATIISLGISFVLEYLLREKITGINDLKTRTYKILGIIFGIIGILLLSLGIIPLYINSKVDTFELKKVQLVEGSESNKNYFSIEKELDFHRKIVIKKTEEKKEQQFYIPLKTQDNIKYVILIEGQESDIYINGERKKKVDFSKINKIKFDSYLGKNKLSEQAKVMFQKEGYVLSKDTYLIEPTRKVPYEGLIGMLYTYGFEVFILGIDFIGLAWTLFYTNNDKIINRKSFNIQRQKNKRCKDK